MWYHIREAILFVILGGALGIGGIHSDTWEFWVVLTTAIVISLNNKYSK